MINQYMTGIWSVDCMYGPGAQGDERIVFQDNGLGWIENHELELYFYRDISLDI